MLGYPQGYPRHFMIFQEILEDILTIEGYPLKVSLRISWTFKNI